SDGRSQSEVGHHQNHLLGGGSSRAAACSFWCERDRGSSREAFQALRDPDPAMQRMTAIVVGAGSSPLQVRDLDWANVGSGSRHSYHPDVSGSPQERTFGYCRVYEYTAYSTTRPRINLLKSRGSARTAC